ncbi:MAG: hypothetical protein ACE15B_09210 [Bryobacteraceae bacterium]
MEFLWRAPGRPATAAVLPAAFNPPTVAHIALARAALSHAEETILVLPGVLPHKTFEGAAFADRAAMLRAAVEGQPRISAAVSEGGLFLEIARECRQAYGAETALWFVCGGDAAARVAGWDYGRPGAFAEQLEEFGLLVAQRGPRFRAFGPRIRELKLDRGVEHVSSTEVRRRIASGEPWEHLVPPEVVPLARTIYGGV